MIHLILYCIEAFLFTVSTTMTDSSALQNLRAPRVVERGKASLDTSLKDCNIFNFRQPQQTAKSISV